MNIRDFGIERAKKQAKEFCEQNGYDYDVIEHFIEIFRGKSYDFHTTCLMSMLNMIETPELSEIKGVIELMIKSRMIDKKEIEHLNDLLNERKNENGD